MASQGHVLVLSCCVHDSVENTGLGPDNMSRHSGAYRGCADAVFRGCLPVGIHQKQMRGASTLVPRWAGTNRYIRTSCGIGETLDLFFHRGFENDKVESFDAPESLIDLQIIKQITINGLQKIRRPCGLNLDSLLDSILA